MATRTFSYENSQDRYFLEKTQIELQKNTESIETYRGVAENCSARIDDLKKALSESFNKLPFYFNIDPAFNKIFKKIKIFHVDGAFQRANNSKITHHDMLLNWKKVPKYKEPNISKIFLMKYKGQCLTNLRSRYNQHHHHEDAVGDIKIRRTVVD